MSDRFVLVNDYRAESESLRCASVGYNLEFPLICASDSQKIASNRKLNWTLSSKCNSAIYAVRKEFKRLTKVCFYAKWFVFKRGLYKHVCSRKQLLGSIIEVVFYVTEQFSF